MDGIVIGILAFFMLVVIGILRAILTQSDAKRSDQSPRWIPQRRKDKPSQPKVTRLPQAPSPIQPDIREKGEPYFSKRPPRIPKSVPDPFDYQAGW